LAVGTGHFVRFLPALAACAAAPLAFAQEAGPNLNGYATLSTANWKHGFAQNKGASAQLGIDFEHPTGFYAGGWAANVDFAQEYSQEESRVASRPTSTPATTSGASNGRGTLASATICIPGAAVNYDYNEVSATFGFRDRVFYTAAYSDAYYGRWRASLNQEVSFTYPFAG